MTEYSDVEIVNAAHEVAEKTGVPFELLKCTTPDNMEALASAVINDMERKAPKVHALPRGKRSMIIRGDEHAPTNGEQFANLICEQMRWA